jgi:hypothetical protein
LRGSRDGELFSLAAKGEREGFKISISRLQSDALNIE